MEEDKGIKDLLKEISEKLDENKAKKKSLSIPFTKRVTNKLAKKGYISIFRINSNRILTVERLPVEDNTIVIDGVPRIVTPDEILFYKKNPVIILPSWSVKPFSPSENYEKTVRDHYTSAGYRLLMNRMKNEIVQPKKSFGGAGLIIGLLALVAIGYFAVKGGWFS